MSELDRVVAGLSCHEVLAELSDYVDGELARERVRQIRNHLAGCDRCERFGGVFAEVVTRFRESLGPPEPVGHEVARRLADRLREVMRSGAR